MNLHAVKTWPGVEPKQAALCPARHCQWYLSSVTHEISANNEFCNWKNIACLLRGENDDDLRLKRAIVLVDARKLSITNSTPFSRIAFSASHSASSRKTKALNPWGHASESSMCHLFQSHWCDSANAFSARKRAVCQILRGTGALKGDYLSIELGRLDRIGLVAFFFAKVKNNRVVWCLTGANFSRLRLFAFGEQIKRRSGFCWLICAWQFLVCHQRGRSWFLIHENLSCRLIDWKGCMFCVWFKTRPLKM